jgi:hypothetical protein
MEWVLFLLLRNQKLQEADFEAMSKSIISGKNHLHFIGMETETIF